MASDGLADKVRSVRDKLARRGVKVRAIVSVSVIALTILVFGTLITLVTYQSSVMVTVLTVQHEPKRAAMDTVADNLFQLNNRLLGIMADVYSAPGSVDKVTEFGKGIIDGWRAIEEHGVDNLDPASVGAARATVVALPDFLDRLTQALSKGGSIGDWVCPGRC